MDNRASNSESKTIDKMSREEQDHLFDDIIGYIEELLLDEKFQDMQQDFLERYWHIFEPVEDNKLIYTDIFNEYTKVAETHIVDHLQKRMPQFTLDFFLQLYNEKKEKLEGEVFDVLLRITDFLAFKDMFLDYRAMKEGKVKDLSCGILITPLKRYYTDELPE
ncbi:hypothetical protein HN011_008964 [Eciton burchellii]|nr:hypothetical protein HN011_008964 [Eciton burchellii]